MGFSIPRICGLISVQQRTLKRRLKEYGIKIRDKYSSISDGDLDVKINGILQCHPMIGPHLQ